MSTTTTETMPQDTAEILAEAEARGIDLARWVDRLDALAAEAEECPSCSAAAAWYTLKSEDLARLAERSGYSHRDIVRAYAVLSQNASVGENDANIVRLALGHEPKGFASRTDRARRALGGDWSAIVYGNGLKISSFDDNLADPHGSTATTMDRHAIDILTEDRGLTSRLLGWAHRLGYRIAEAVYAIVARRRGYADHERMRLQAVVWVHHAHRRNAVAYGDWLRYAEAKGIL